MKKICFLVLTFLNLNCFANVKAVIFDCDGTLVDSEYSHLLAWDYALNKIGSGMTLGEYSPYVGKPSSAIQKMLAEKLGQETADQLHKEKCTQFLNLCEEGLIQFEHTVNLLKALLKQKESLKLKIGVCSAAKRQEILLHLRNIGVEKDLDIILSGQDDLNDYFDPEGVNKPKPYIYLHAAKLLGIAPSECVVIEDSITGVKSAVDAGCFTIAVPNEFTKLHDLSSANLRIDSFVNFSAQQFLQMVGP